MEIGYCNMVEPGKAIKTRKNFLYVETKSRGMEARPANKKELVCQNR